MRRTTAAVTGREAEAEEAGSRAWYAQRPREVAPEYRGRVTTKAAFLRGYDKAAKKSLRKGE